jgi:hypothetical protein
VVTGLELFKAWFADHAKQYVLIGGTAATLTMEAAGLSFRATKDLDIVLHVESLDSAFGKAFWEFITAGGYQCHQADATIKPSFYRFQKPSDPEFPAILELFARKPDALPFISGKLTPIPFDESLSSLSAILLNDAYYNFIFERRRDLHGMPYIGEDGLIPLKALAWLQLKQLKSQGTRGDSRNIRKHAHDILRLSQLLSPASSIPLPLELATDMRRFISEALHDTSLKADAIGIRNVSATDLLHRIASVYQLNI